MPIDITNPGASANTLRNTLIEYANPLPFFGTATQTQWPRPTGNTFSLRLNINRAGQANAVVIDNANGLPLVMMGPQDGTTYSVSAALKTPIGSPPWTITVSTAGFGPTKSGPLITYPICLYNQATDKMITTNWYLGDATDAGTFNLGYVANASVGGAASSNENNGGWGFSSSDYLEWFRVHNDGTNLTYSVSPEGQLWFPTYVEAVSNFVGNVTHVGFGVERLKQVQVTGSNLACIIWSWVETTP